MKNNEIENTSTEIITGDMPTPVKYYNETIQSAYKEVEKIAEEKLLERLPEDLRPTYEQIYHPSNSVEDDYLRQLVKAADKISALIKCIEEERSGNTEFRTAKETTQKSINELQAKYPEVLDFVNEFLPSYGRTLDELSDWGTRDGF